MESSPELIGESIPMKRLRKEILQLAKSQHPLVLKGDAGSGKGVVTRLIYDAMGVKGTANVVTHGMPDSEVLSMISEEKKDISLIVVQEIEKFSFLQQSYILRLIKALPKKPFIQIIITSTKSISDMQREKIILGELFDLIKSYEFVTIPSLLQRQSDIPFLVEYFTKKVAESTGTRQKIVDANTMDFLVRREWKENVRELKSVVERAVFSSSSDYLELPESLIDEYAQLEGIITNIKSKQPFSFDKSLYNLEKRLIERVLDSVGNNQSKTASILKLSEANLRYRLKKFHIPTSQDKR